mmetsp:Transcript_22708/g.52989  ORF Transcript_22708/g.52989 Transcript_22708/m.52989 type:complete len:120 (-) Transcript_22708:181-540(-)
MNSRLMFTILAFPCNQFLSQEPGTDQEIRDRLQKKYGVPKERFFLFDKIEVNGPNTHDVYKFLRTAPGISQDKISWNFAKFLVDQNGAVVKRYGPKESPLTIEPEISRLLASTSEAPPS